MNTLRNFAKSVFAHIFSKFKYFAKQFTLTRISRPRASLSYIWYVHILKVRIFFEQPFWSHCRVILRKLLVKLRNQNIFPIFKMNPIVAVKFLSQRYIVCWGKICRPKIMGGGGGALNYLYLLFCKIVYNLFT